MSKGLTKHQLEIISAAVLKERSKQKKLEERDKKDWRLRNTRLLLKNYRLLEKHCDEITEDLDDYGESIFDPEDLSLETLMKYKARTKKMLDYFNVTFGSYLNYCNQMGDSVQRRGKVLEALYVSCHMMKKQDLAELYNVDERTIYRDEKKAITELSVFLFGIDSLEDLAHVIFVS